MEHIGRVIEEKDRNIVLKGADVLSASGFTQVPYFILRQSDYSPLAKLAYSVLLSYAWHNDFCFPGQEKLAEDMGVSVRSVKTYLQELNKKGAISIKRRGQGKTNIYELNLKPVGKKK